MARTWTAVYSSVCTSKKLARCSSDTPRTFWFLLTLQADAFGRIEDDPETLNGRCWPLLKRTDEQTADVVDELVRVGLVSRHEANGMRWLQVECWDEHQGRHKGGKHGKSRFPEPSGATRVSPETPRAAPTSPELPRNAPTVSGQAGGIRGSTLLSSPSGSDPSSLHETQQPPEKPPKAAPPRREPKEPEVAKSAAWKTAPAGLGQKAPSAARRTREPSGRHQEIWAVWRRVYEETMCDDDGHALAYDNPHPRDAKAVDAFVRVTQANPPSMAEVERRARILMRSQGRFWVENRNLHTLMDRWTDIPSLPAGERAAAAAKAPPKSFAQESFENLVSTSPSLNPEGFAIAAASIARPDTSRLPLGATARSLAEQSAAPSQLRALP